MGSLGDNQGWVGSREGCSGPVVGCPCKKRHHTACFYNHTGRGIKGCDKKVAAYKPGREPSPGTRSSCSWIPQTSGPWTVNVCCLHHCPVIHSVEARESSSFHTINMICVTSHFSLSSTVLSDGLRYLNTCLLSHSLSGKAKFSYLALSLLYQSETALDPAHITINSTRRTSPPCTSFFFAACFRSPHPLLCWVRGSLGSNP